MTVSAKAVLVFIRRWFAAALLMFLGTAPLAAQQELPKVLELPLEHAQKAARAAVDACAADGHKVSAAVVDRGGNLKALLRGDGAGPHTTDSSFKKAYTAASLGRPTAEFAKLVAAQPAVQGMRDMNDNILILGGGVPFRLQGEIVGGIGVGGAPGSDLDEACARAGLNALGS